MLMKEANFHLVLTSSTQLPPPGKYQKPTALAFALNHQDVDFLFGGLICCILDIQKKTTDGMGRPPLSDEAKPEQLRLYVRFPDTQ